MGCSSILTTLSILCCSLLEGNPYVKNFNSSSFSFWYGTLFLLSIPGNFMFSESWKRNWFILVSWFHTEKNSWIGLQNCSRVEDAGIYGTEFWKIWRNLFRKPLYPHLMNYFSRVTSLDLNLQINTDPDWLTIKIYKRHSFLTPVII